VILSVLADSVIKIIINGYFLDVRFDIIPNLFEFKPVFNKQYSYVNYLFGLEMGFGLHLFLFCFAFVIALASYDFFKHIPNGRKLLDISFIFAFSGIICAFIGLVTGGCLDYIYLKPLFVFDLKDLYIDCFLILYFYYFFKYKKSLKSVKLKDMTGHFKNRFKSFAKNRDS